MVEKKLNDISRLAFHWRAILLLDEADVFLEQRSSSMLQNTLVTVFLRKLEYFQGVMFLTTNRVKQFDAAMQSRIHFALKFDDLTVKARGEIWTEFLKRANSPLGTVNVHEKHISKLAEKKLNGRQVCFNEVDE